MGHLPCRKAWCQDRKFIELGIFLQGPWWYGLGVGLGLAFKHIFLWWLQCLYLTSVQNLKVSSFVSKTSLLWGSWRFHAVWTHSLSILKMWHFRKLINVAKVLIWKSREASRPFHCPIPWSLSAPHLLSATLDLLSQGKRWQCLQILQSSCKLSIQSTQDYTDHGHFLS